MRTTLQPMNHNIQVSWVKMEVERAKLALQAGANDLGGTRTTLYDAVPV